MDDAPGGLNFTISAVQHGRFSLVSARNYTVKSFLQSQITNHQIQFTHDGSIVAPQYQVSVSDKRVSNLGGPQASKITFHAAPILVTNQLKLNQGQTVVLTSSALSN